MNVLIFAFIDQLFVYVIYRNLTFHSLKEKQNDTDGYVEWATYTYGPDYFLFFTRTKKTCFNVFVFKFLCLTIYLKGQFTQF